MRPSLRFLAVLSLAFVILPRHAFAGGPIASGTIVAGSVSGPSFSETWSFSGTIGDRIIIAAVTTGGSLSTNIILHPPFVGVEAQTSSDRLDWQLQHTGTYTIEITDVGLNDAGNYTLGFTNITSGPYTDGVDLDGGPIASTEVVNGTTSGVGDFDCFTFSATTGDRIIMDCVATAGAGYNTTFYIYPPGGGAAILSSFGDQADILLNATGTWVIQVEDGGNDTAGSYTMSLLNMTSGPLTSIADPDGGAIVSGEIRTGQFNQGVDFDAWTFSGTAGDRIIIGDLPTGAGGHNTQCNVFPPGGGAAVANNANDRFDFQLAQTGTYTLVLQDVGLDNIGAYTIAILNVTAGPHTNPGDLDGAPIASAEVTSGTTSGVGDFDAFTFSATSGDRIMMDCVATAGVGYNTSFFIYPPNGAAPVLSSFGDQADIQLNATGTWTIVVEDAGEDTPGSYTMSLLNMTSGPLTNGTDLDGAPLTSSDVTNGTSSGVADFDAFTFSATNGDRVLIDCIATGGAGYNTTMFLYGPNGAAPLSSTFGDLIDSQLNATGTWTVVVEDNGNDTAGSYTMSLLNVTAGPYTNGGDSDAGAIVSNQIKTGSMQQGVDFDAWQFTGSINDRIVIVGVATAGASYNTQMAIYPPGGGAALTTQANDRFELKLATSGTFTVVMEDAGNDNAGSYALSILNVNAGPYTDGADANGGPIASNQIISATTSGVGDMDAYTFNGTNGNRLLMTAVATGGVGYNTTVYLYPPNGGALATSTFADRMEFKLSASGTWVVLVEDNSDDTPGSYNVCVLDANAGPFTGNGESDGGPILVGLNVAGAANALADFDGFTFTGHAGQTAALTAITTSGAMNTFISLYPPGGGIALTATANDNVSVPLTLDGTYTVVIEDQGQDQTGTYSSQVLLSGGPTGVNGMPPLEFALREASPNPFSDATRLEYTLPAASRVQLRVYDVRGALVRTLVDGHHDAGVHSAFWDGRDERGRRLASGVYFYRIRAAGHTTTRKMVLAR